jgi:hypothetical protein
MSRLRLSVSPRAEGRSPGWCGHAAAPAVVLPRRARLDPAAECSGADRCAFGRLRTLVEQMSRFARRVEAIPVADYSRQVAADHACSHVAQPGIVAVSADEAPDVVCVGAQDSDDASAQLPRGTYDENPADHPLT